MSYKFASCGNPHNLLKVIGPELNYPYGSSHTAKSLNLLYEPLWVSYTAGLDLKIPRSAVLRRNVFVVWNLAIMPISANNNCDAAYVPTHMTAGLAPLHNQHPSAIIAKETIWLHLKIVHIDNAS